MFGRKALKARIEELEKAQRAAQKAAFDALPAGRTRQTPEGKWVVERRVERSVLGWGDWTALGTGSAYAGTFVATKFDSQEFAAEALERWLSPQVVEYDVDPFRRRNA